MVDTATHWKNWLVDWLIENWVITQRFAALSYITTGSPLLVVSHGPPNPCQSELPAAGP